MSTFEPPSPPSHTSPRTVTVTGTARSTAPPDRATISLGVQTRAASAGEALTTVAQRATALISALRDVGGEGELHTNSLSLWRDQQSTPTTFVAGNTVSATITPDKVGEAIDATARAGGDDFTLNGVSFSIADAAPLIAPLREQALADARARAEMLAGPEGYGVGEALSIVEGAGGGVSPIARGTAMALSMPVEPGTESVSLSVTVTYQLVPTT